MANIFWLLNEGLKLMEKAGIVKQGLLWYLYIYIWLDQWATYSNSTYPEVNKRVEEGGG